MWPDQSSISLWSCTSFGPRMFGKHHHWSRLSRCITQTYKNPTLPKTNMTNRKRTINEDVFICIYIKTGDFPTSHASFQGVSCSIQHFSVVFSHPSTGKTSPLGSQTTSSGDPWPWRSGLMKTHWFPLRPAMKNPYFWGVQYVVRGGVGWPAMNENHRCFMGIFWFHGINLQNLFLEHGKLGYSMKRMESWRKITQKNCLKKMSFVRLASKIPFV